MKQISKYLKGSYTIEAALLFPIVIFSVFFIIYSAFFMHNQSVIREAVYETAIYGTTLNLKNTNEMKQKLQKKCQTAIEGRLISMKKPQVFLSVKKNCVSVQISGEMSTTPLWFLPNYNGSKISVQKSVSAKNPIQTIQMLKLMKGLQE